MAYGCRKVKRKEGISGTIPREGEEGRQDVIGEPAAAAAVVVVVVVVVAGVRRLEQAVRRRRSTDR